VHVYLINLDRAPERLAFVQAQFDALGMTFERIAAVDATKITLADVSDTVRPEGAWMGRAAKQFVTAANGQPMVASPILGRYITVGEVACFQSHIKAISKFIESGAPYACIFEDDVELAPDLATVVDAVATKIDYGIVKLEGLAAYEHDIGRKIVDVGSRSVRFRFKPATGAAGYFMTRAAAVKFLATLHPIREPYDSWLRQYWRHGIPLYEVSPFPAKQAPAFLSAIYDRRDQPKVEYISAARLLLAPIKFWYKTLRVVRRFAFFAVWGRKLI